MCFNKYMGRFIGDAPMYIIPEFTLHDKNDSSQYYTIKNMLVAVPQNIKIGCQLLLGATMFINTAYTINNKNKKAKTLTVNSFYDTYYCIPDTRGIKIVSTIKHYISKVTTVTKKEMSILKRSLVNQNKRLVRKDKNGGLYIQIDNNIEYLYKYDILINPINDSMYIEYNNTKYYLDFKDTDTDLLR